AALYGEINRDPPRMRLKLVALAAALSMAVNWLRIVIIVIAGYLTDMQHYLVSREHLSFGWVMFALTMAVFFLIVRRWPLPAASEPAASMGASPDRTPPAAVAMTAAVLLVAPLWMLLDRNRSELSEVAPVLPRQVSGWEVERGAGVDWQPVFAGADAT